MFSSRKTGSASNNYLLTRSLRFRSSASAYLNRTPASAGNRKTWTYSTWIKLGEIAASNGTIFSAGTTSGESTRFYLRYTGSQFQTGYGSQNLDTTVAVFRDPSAWYHLVLTVDTTQATAANRLKIYVNGVQQSVTTSVNFTQNVDTAVNNTVAHNICREAAISTGYVDGYLAEVNFIDGQALTPSSFGQTNPATGVWQPIKYTGTYGTNGFYLNFSDNSNNTATTIGKDYSGNGNNWTPNNISVTSGATYDSMTDVPTLTNATTANYCVLNPLSKGANVSATNGNLNAVISGASAESLQSTLGMFSGKWYCEMTAGGGGSIFGITTVGANLSSWVGSDTKGYGYRGDTGAVMYNSSALVSGMSTFASGDVISLAFDADAGKLWFAKNGTWYNSGNPSAGTNATVSSIASGNWFVSVGRINTTNDAQLNFGQQSFAYTPPTGFVALNTFNLPTPTIGATASSQAGKYFNAVLYTGNGSTGRAVTGLGFKPDFTWIKGRSDADYNYLVDIIRTYPNRLFSNLTDAASTESNTVTSSDNDGFTVGSDAGVNRNNSTYVAWNWKANGSGLSNTDGSITSTVSANTTAGFSIATFTCPASGNFTVGHGLGVAPAMFILKTRSAVDGWYVYHQSLATPASNYLVLNTTAATATSTSIWGNTNPTSTVLTLGTNAGIAANATGVLYCFAQVAGYSAFGSYTGNGSSDGPFIYTGFRPRYVLIKKSSSATDSDWRCFDTARNTYNVVDLALYPNLSNAEGTFSVLDFISNGFKLRNTGAGTNANSETYIYMAFAEFPFRYSLAR